MEAIRRAVITAAGLGTRLLPMTKELPKEMLPIFARNAGGELVLKPLLQALFEQLYVFGVREFFFVVGRGKRAIENHFTPDWDYVAKLENRGKYELASMLRSFYEMVERSIIVWVNQPEPRGFGHAVYMAWALVDDEPFIVCAGDTYVISKGNGFLKRMVEAHTKGSVDATLLLQEVPDPRQYGVAVVEELGEGVYRVLKVVEKPRTPPSRYAIMPYYIFNPIIMEVLRDLKPGVGGEIQLTDAIQRLIDMDREVRAVFLRNDEIRLDIGTPETYWEALKLSYEYWTGARK